MFRCFLLLVATTFSAVAGAVSASAATIQAQSPAFDHVSSAVAKAASGDTVLVPAGSATWSSTLVIDRRIWLQGAGAGLTVITGNVGPTAYLVRYAPADAASESYFRLSGFTFDSKNNSRILSIARETVDAATWIRIDHNRFIASTDRSVSPMWQLRGLIWGVVDSNRFDNHAHIDNYGLQADSWAHTAYVPGSANTLYYEDNVFHPIDIADSGGHGGRYVKRYNTYNLADPAPSSGFYPLWDAHGNQPGPIYSTMGIELYGNRVVGSYVMRLLDQRGGKAMVFYNKVLSSAPVQLRVSDEYADSISQPATAPDGTPQRVNSSYYWNNRSGAEGDTLIAAIKGVDVEGLLVENKSWFNQVTAFTGSNGIGCGPVSSMPVSCSAGHAFWASASGCAAVDDSSVGANPSSPITGTLYRCTSSGKWAPFFTPYTYPHPFRGPSSTGPAPPSDLRIVP